MSSKSRVERPGSSREVAREGPARHVGCPAGIHGDPIGIVFISAAEESAVLQSTSSRIKFRHKGITVRGPTVPSCIERIRCRGKVR